MLNFKFLLATRSNCARIWAKGGRDMNGIIFVIGVVGAVISYVVLYFIIKTAVRNGISESKYIHQNIETSFVPTTHKAQYLCAGCDKYYDIDLPQCPHCGTEDNRR